MLKSIVVCSISITSQSNPAIDSISGIAGWPIVTQEPMDNWWICLNCNEVADSETVKEIKQWINNKGN